MSWAAEIAAAKREAINFCKGALAQLFVYTLTAKASAIGDADAIEASDEAKAPGLEREAKPQRKVVRIQPFGFNGVPPKGLRSLTLQLGKSNLFFVGVAPTTAYGPQNLNPGAVAVYSKGGATLVLDENGVVTATDAGGATAKLDGSGNVSINPKLGGTVKLGDQAGPSGKVALGPVGTLAVLVQGTVDSMGVPVTQNPAATATIVKAG